ncbi:hypothetical protein P154DRAFT_50555 [Amniculicola lignicola CBS 123094]|uniref:RNI-like protein n=1 Tax=Amniculicola lignicola CBS 123094 TaxID=1392246 RepID=A0A6A5WSZ5_9PLEO|nr:hypothetical protein P154DRAFT_50555 [Amniculicola lignicola CBS 123094]
MASSSTLPPIQNKSSSIHGSAISIFDLKDGAKIAKELLSDPSLPPEIKRLEILLPVPDEEEENDEDEPAATTTITTQAQPEPDTQSIKSDDNTSVKSSGSAKSAEGPITTGVFATVDEEMTEYCCPIIQILNAVEQSRGGLQEFVWDMQGVWGLKGVRPPEFWKALWKHARTLRVLSLEWYTHEVSKTLAPQVVFPGLKELSLDASTAHGDKGDVVEWLLSNSANLETLKFTYPGCDLDTCQIKGLTWNYTFPNLRVLELEGYDFDAGGSTQFLSRCANIEFLKDGLDWDQYECSEDEKTKRALSITALPKLRALCLGRWGAVRKLENWFSIEAKREIRHLRIGTQWPQLKELGVLGGRLKCLEIDGSVTDWRPKPEREDTSSDSEPESESDEEETKSEESDEGKKGAGDEDEVKEAEDEYKDAESEKAKEPIPTPSERIQILLSQLPNLKELGVGMGSGNISMSLPNGKWGSPPPMNAEDLASILSYLPVTHPSLRALRVWDDVADPLPHSLLADFPSVPENLEYLCWDAKVRVLYRLERYGGNVRAVECDESVVRVRDEDGLEWVEERVLEY